MGDSYFDSKLPQSISCVKKINPNLFKCVSNKIIQTPSTFSFTTVYLEKKKTCWTHYHVCIQIFLIQKLFSFLESWQETTGEKKKKIWLMY